MSDRAFEEVLEKLVVVALNVEGVCLPHNKLTSTSVFSLAVRIHLGFRFFSLLFFFFFFFLFSRPPPHTQSSMNMFSRLSHLDLSHNMLGYVGASSVAKAALCCDSLVWLSLAGNNIGGKDSGALMEYLFGPKSRLRHVVLSDNKLGLEGVQTMAKWLGVNTALTDLHLENVGITETGLGHLFQGLGSNCFLERLSVARNPIPKLSQNRQFTENIVTLFFHNVALVELVTPDVGSYFQEKVQFARNQNHTLKKCPDMGYFSDRLWRSIPMPVFAHAQLTKLDLSNNLLAGLPYAILQLKALEYLNLTNNLIEVGAVPVHLREMASLVTLRIDSNPFVSYIPERYNLMELDDIFAFFDFFCESTLNGVHVKTVVLGATRSGKTRFVKALAQAGPETAGSAAVGVTGKRRSGRDKSADTLGSVASANTSGGLASLGSTGNVGGVGSGGNGSGSSVGSVGGGVSSGDGSGGSGANSSSSSLEAPSNVGLRRGSMSSSKSTSDNNLASLVVDGINSQVSVTKVMLPLPDRGARLNVWDFSIPDVESHPMIQFYLSDGAFFVIVVNPSNSEWRESLVHWKSTIEGRVTRADVFFVVTHKDRSSHAATNVAAEITRDFLPHGPAARRTKQGGISYHGVWTTSSNPKDTAPVLAKMAVVASPRVSELGRVPVPWSVMESMLAEEEKVISFPLVSFARFEAMAIACGALDDEVARMARYLHETGAIIHYSDIKKLAHVVVLSPLWLLKVASRLVSFESPTSTTGTFRAEDLPDIWPAYDFPPRSHEPIVQLLEAFEVLNPLGQVFVMPFLVPDKAPPAEDWPLNRVVMAIRYERKYTFSVNKVPRTLMAQLIIRLLEISTRAFSIWQSGVIFSIKERTFSAHDCGAFGARRSR